MPQAWSGNRIEPKGIGVSEGGGALTQGQKEKGGGGCRAWGAGAGGDSPGPAVRFLTVGTGAQPEQHLKSRKDPGAPRVRISTLDTHCADFSNHSDLDLRRSF